MKQIIKSILIVDDSPNDVTLIKNVLKKAHFANEIVVAEDGEEAIDFLYKRGKFENINVKLPIFILLDIKMPLLNGLEVLKIIRSDKQFNKVPVIILTSSNNPRDLEECYQNGANSYVVKPINIDDFIRAISDLGHYWIVVNELPQ